MKYANLSSTSKTFHGITIKPGEVKDFPGYVNHPDMYMVGDISLSKPAKKIAEKKPIKNSKQPKEEKPNGKHNHK